jgi:hypothetical protein
MCSVTMFGMAFAPRRTNKIKTLEVLRHFSKPIRLITGGARKMGETTKTAFEERRADTDTGRSSLLTGLFRDREGAERAYQSLNERGYGKDDVNL